MPYVPNHERIELGLQGYGSDVPQDVLDAAIARRDQALQQPKPVEDPPKAVKAPRKRARKPKGHLVADDPTTPDRNEAWEEG